MLAAEVFTSSFQGRTYIIKAVYAFIVSRGPTKIFQNILSNDLLKALNLAFQQVNLYGVVPKFLVALAGVASDDPGLP